MSDAANVNTANVNAANVNIANVDAANVDPAKAKCQPLTKVLQSSSGYSNTIQNHRDLLKYGKLRLYSCLCQNATLPNTLIMAQSS